MDLVSTCRSSLALALALVVFVLVAHEAAGLGNPPDHLTDLLMRSPVGIILQMLARIRLAGSGTASLPNTPNRPRRCYTGYRCPAASVS